MSKQDVFVHPSSFIDEPCTIGQGTKIWHFCHVMAGAVIGENCSLGQNVFVSAGAVLGNNVKVQNNVSIYDGVILEDDTFCGPSLVFTNVINPRSHVSRKHEYQKTKVKQGATLGANATIVCGNTIGAYAMIGAGSVVTSDVPDFAMMLGVPARLAGYRCRCGEKLGAISPSQGQPICCPSCRTAYLMEDGGLRMDPDNR